MGERQALRVRSFSDDEASIERVAGWDLHCLQMSPGVLAGESLELQLPSMQLLFEAYRNVRTSHCGTAPRGAVVFGIAVAMAGEGRLNGRPWCDGLSAFDARQELVSVVPPVELTTLVVDRQRLCEHLRITEQVDLPRWLSEAPVVVHDRALAQRLAQHLRGVRAAGLAGRLRADADAAQQQLVDEILDLLCPALVSGLGIALPHRGEGPHVDLVRRARDRVLQRADEPPRIVDLCRDLGVSRRWLQWSFNEVMGLGPRAWLQLVRLNGARRMLLRGAPGAKVADAIEAFGFWHPSRFSRDYRRHFGELPSRTLQRALARG